MVEAALLDVGRAAEFVDADGLVAAFKEESGGGRDEAFAGV